MNNPLFRFIRRSSSLIIVSSAILSLVASVRGAIDDNATEGVWKVKYGVTDSQLYIGGIQANGPNLTWRNADDDGDGLANGAEIGAGTNPFDRAKTVKVSSVVKNGAMVDLQFPTESGKLYQIQSTTTLGVPGSWATQVTTPLQLIGDGSTRTLSTAYAANTFYRVRVLDTDTDNDGVANWAEIAVGLNPAVAQIVAGLTTVNYVLEQTALPSVVTITAPEPFASEDGPTQGKFTVTRTRTLLPITVTYNLSGTAVTAVDYADPGSTTLTFPGLGAASQDIFVNPIDLSPTIKGGRSVTATLQPPGGSGVPPFTLGAKSTATVIINSSTEATGNGLLARYYDTASTTQADAANFGQLGTYVFTRGTPTTTGSIVVTPATPAHFAGLAQGDLVKLTFTTGNAAIDNATFDHQNYTVTAVGATTFTVSISSISAFSITTTSGNCSFSLQSIPQPATITRVDATVNNDWQHGTPNGVVILPNNSPENYSAVWEGYLHPTTAGNYTFQLDADDKARVLLDLDNDGAFTTPGEQIVEHGWDTNDGILTPEVVGTFKLSAAIPLVVPATPAARYKIRVEHVETTGNARCRLQWRLNTGGFANIPTANQFTHTQAATYTFVRSNATTGTATVTLAGHGLASGPVTVWFSAGNLFTPNISDPAGYSGTFATISNVTTNTFDVAITGTNLPANVGTATACFLENRPLSTTTGLFNRCYANTTFTDAPGRVGVDGNGNNGTVTAQNNGIWNSGTPDLALIQLDTFSIRWTGQVQPQFSEDYTFVVQADDGCALWINGQPQVLKMNPSANTGVGTYTYDATTGNLTGTYQTAIVPPGSFIAGETARLEFGSGNLNHAPTTSPTYTYNATTGDVVVDYTNLIVGSPGGTVTAESYTIGDVVELDPTSGSVSALGNTPYTITAVAGNTFTVNFGTGVYAAGTGNMTINDNRNSVITTVHATGTGTYSYVSSTGDAVVNYSSLGLPAGTFVDGQKIVLDPTSGNLNSVASAFYTISAVTPTTFTANFGPSFTTGIGNMFIVAPSNGAIPASSTTAFTVNIGAGKYAANSIGNINVDLANKSLKDWSSNGNERYVRIPMIGGVRYDIRLDYYENTGGARAILSWFSASQPKQVIPSNRLYPSSDPIAPTTHISPTDATALVGGFFSHAVAASNGGIVTISGNPAWLSYAGGVISGTPPLGAAGDYQITITTTNAAGTTTSLLNLHVDENAGSVVREYWSGINGTSVSLIPTGNPPSGTTTLTTLLGPTNFSENFGARIRGYITAPTTGNYYFWIAASNAAELWISNDDDPVNALKRAWVTTGNPTPQQWNTPTTQKSPWLALEAGQRYYFEVLHKAGIGADHLAVGWLKPGQTGNVPSEIVPSYVLSPWVAIAPAAAGSTVYAATLRPQSGVATNASGTSFIRLNAAETEAIVSVKYSGLSSGYFGMHIHNDEIDGGGLANVICDFDEPGDVEELADGTFKWVITTRAGRDPAQLVADLKAGKVYFNVHSTIFPNGEIKGYYGRVDGSQTFTPPPAPPAWTDDHATSNGAARFLSQATFGANPADIAALKAMASYEAWINDQFTKPQTLHLPEVLAREVGDVFGPFDVRVSFNTWWKSTISGQDQLRQKVAFALSQIHVVSGQGPLEDNSRALSDFYDTLAANAFGNFRDILIDTTLAPAMGRYLDMLRNDKPDLAVGRSPNENYAREIKQLFSIGLYRMWPNGTLILNSKFEPVDTYTQREIVGLSHVFTGWDYGYDGAFRTALNAPADWTRPMREVPVRHFTGPKRVLNNEVLPGLATLGGQPLDPYATHLSSQYYDPAYEALPAAELDAAHDQLFNHPNTGPFICRQLIQRMVTSHPSNDYVYRVVQKFNDNGSGIRGDMQAVIKAILLDYEARSGTPAAVATYGKQREPIQRIANAARAFRPGNITGTYAQTGTNLITITTSTPHLLQNNNSVFLEFTDATLAGAQPAPTTGTYVVTVTGANTYTIPAPGWMTGTYSQSGTTITVTMNGHWLPGDNANVIPSPQVLPAANKGQAYFDFITGPANGVASFDQTVRTVVTSTSYDIASGVGNSATAPSINGNASGTTFTITAPYSATTSGQTVMISRFPGSYSSTGRAGVITIDTAYGGVGTYGVMADHGLSVGDSVFINFANSRDTTSGDPTSTDNDVVYTVASVPDANTFTVAALDAANAAMNSDNQAFIFPHKAQPMVRNGTVNTRQGTFTMDNTDTDLQQTPLNSPTVFNYFLPDYKFAGTLANNGLTTPEFELTSETTVIRQANFLYNGIFNPSNTTGISSFKSGTNALVLDLSPWMGAAVNTVGSIGYILGDGVLGSGQQTGQVWTSNANLPTLVDRLNTLLMAGQLPAAAKTQILNFIGRQITSVSTGSPCTFNMGAAHGLVAGDTVTITGITGGTWSGASTSGNGTFTVLNAPTSSTVRLTNLNCTSTTTNGGLNLTNSTLGIVPYTNAAPTAQNIRDRLRAIVHFILTSPDFTIQK